MGYCQITQLCSNVPHFPILDTDYTDGHGLGSVIRLLYPSLPKEIAVSSHALQA